MAGWPVLALAGLISGAGASSFAHCAKGGNHEGTGSGVRAGQKLSRRHVPKSGSFLPAAGCYESDPVGVVTARLARE